MSKKLKAFVDEELYKKIAGQPVSGEDSIIPILRKWYDICRNNTGNIPVTDYFSCWHEAYFFLDKLSNRKVFEKVIKKAGYDLDNLFYSIWKETVTERIIIENGEKSRKLSELYSKLNEMENEGLQAAGNTILAAENKELKLSLAKLQEELTKTKQSGGKIMDGNNQIPQWEYKTIEKDPYKSKEEFEKNLNELGQNGWEASGTFSLPGGSGTMIFKRPKSEKKEPDYSYSR